MYTPNTTTKHHLLVQTKTCARVCARPDPRKWPPGQSAQLQVSPYHYLLTLYSLVCLLILTYIHYYLRMSSLREKVLYLLILDPVRSCSLFPGAKNYAILYYTIIYYTILYYATLYYTILYYPILSYTILHSRHKLSRAVRRKNT